MLCELSSLTGDTFLGVWLGMNALMALSIFVSSSITFYHYYWPSQITFEKWQYKVLKTYVLQRAWVSLISLHDPSAAQSKVGSRTRRNPRLAV